MRCPAAALGLCGVLALPIAACSEAPVSDAGKAALESRCSRCHAIGLDDTSKHAEAPPFREVVRRYPPENLAEALAEGIQTGHPDMPEFVMDPDEIGAVIAYLESLMPKP